MFDHTRSPVQASASSVDVVPGLMERESNELSGSKTGRALRLVAYAATAYLLASMLSTVLGVMLVMFAGLLAAIALNAGASGLARLLHIPRKLALAIVCLALAGLGVGFVAIIGPSLTRELDELRVALPSAIDQLAAHLNQEGWGRAIVDAIGDFDITSRETMRGAAGAVQLVIGGITGGFLVAFIALFIAAEPESYKRGLLRLAQVSRRERYAEVLEAAASTLRRWLLAKLVGMVVIGALTWTGLTLLGIPVAFTLAALAGLLTFIPNIGPVIAAVPPVLLAFVEGTSTAAAVLVMYAGIQAVESYIITPLLQRQMMKLLPAMTLGAQAVLGVLAGPIGIVVATPLVAVTIVIVRMLYVEDHLEAVDLQVTGDTRLRS